MQKIERNSMGKLSSYRLLPLMWRGIVRRQLQLSRWKLQYALAVIKQKSFDTNGGVEGHGRVCALQNSLPNTGGFPLSPAQCAPELIISSIKNPQERRTSVTGFDGFALDDALAFTDEYKHFSFFRLVRAIARIAGDHSARNRFSILELGCGGGDLCTFFRLMGVNQYLGVDVNPIAFANSPHILGRENHFRQLNLQQEINFGATFDIVCSFEVLEHIREDHLDSLIKTIRHHLGPQSLFLGTASLQDDLDVHITVRPRVFWLDRFREFGLTEHPKHGFYEMLLAQNHPFNWGASNTNIFALKLAS